MPMIGAAGNFGGYLMKRTFLISTAAAALVAGTVFAAAQGAQQQAPSGGAMERNSPSQGQAQRGSDQTQSEPRGQDREQSQPSERRGQAQGQQRDQGQPKTSGQGQPKAGQSESQQQGQQGQGQRQPEGRQGQNPEGQGQQRQQGAQQQKSGSSGSASFTTEQRTKIRETVIRGGNAPRVTNVNFSVKVGTVVPTSVKVVTVPEVIVEVHPEWRGFMYFVYNDEIIIVDRNHNIVAVLEV
jgi:hypothetical protein